MLWTGGDFLNWERRLADSAGNALDDPKDRAKAQNAAFSRLDAMRRYCETDTCRRGLILDYFGDEHDEYCDNCGNCTYVADCDQPTAKRTKTTGTTASRNLNFEEIDATITEFVYDRERMLGFGYGIRKTIRSLMGDTGEGVDDRDIDQLDGYGASRTWTRTSSRTASTGSSTMEPSTSATTTRYWSHNEDKTG